MAMMLMAWLFLLLVLPAVYGQISPCPNTFNYVRWDQSGKWDGRITYQSADDLIDGVFMVLVFDKPSILVGADFGKNVIKKNETEYLLRNFGYVLKANTPLTVNFFIEYDPRKSPPVLTAIRVNGRQVCPNHEPANVGYITSKPDYEALHNPEQEEFELDSQPLNSPALPAVLPTTAPTAHFFLENFAKPQSNLYQCGTATAKPVGLIASGGEEAAEGEWPWHVSLIKFEGPRFNYLCGGTLIGVKHVLTAAHCVTVLQTTSVISPKTLSIFLGQPNLRYVSEHQQQRDVSDIIIHPDFTQSGLKNDIAILKLDHDVQVTDYVKPICLWMETISLESVKNRLGTVVGFGADQEQSVSPVLRKVKIPVVTHSDCILSNVNFFSSVVWQKNYCAGYHNATSVCNGDSGGGMYFPLTGTSGSKTIWQIRGLVSLGFAGLQSKKVCDYNEFTVFTDVAQYLTWIKHTMAN